MRDFNVWILRQGSIKTNTFPSLHVAIAFASALVMLWVEPLWVGLVCVWVAISIAMGAVGGRYHYAGDAILGALAALAGFLVAIALMAAK